MNFNEPEGQVARWLESLAEYDFEIEHRSGKKHQNADALSRREESRQVTSDSVPQRTVEELACSSLQIRADVAQQDDVRHAYQADPDLAVVVDRLSRDKHGFFPGDPAVVRSLMNQENSLKLENGLLYHKFVPMNPSSQVVLQLLVPRRHRTCLFQEGSCWCHVGSLCTQAHTREVTPVCVLARYVP